MKIDHAASRLTCLLAATSLTVSSLEMTRAFAQPSADPPARVGRLAALTGGVSIHGTGATDWTAASLNLPLTNGDAVWTQPGSRAAIDISDDLVALDESTEFDLATLDTHQFVATEPQGELFLDLRDLSSGDTATITTPRGVVQIAGAGQYDIAAGDSAAPTTVSVVVGSARIVSGSFSLTVAANQTATITGGDALQGAIGPLVRGPFLSDQLRRLAPTPSGPEAIRHMTGCGSLAAYGSWQPNAEYGQVWYPRVDRAWTPYREGSWAYVAPWGWTWVDDEPWGFAPFHYGRWAQVDGRWGWVPVEQQAPPDAYEQPVYAPALVDFVVAGAAVGLLAGTFGGQGDQRGGGDIGWVPLGPHERYRPSFAVSPSVLRRLNPGRIDPDRPDGRADPAALDSHVNRGALTVVPADAMARSEPVGRIARTGAAALAGGETSHGGATRYQPVHGAFPIRPVSDTRGVTPAVAQTFGFDRTAPRATAPGPAVDPALFRPHELPADRAPFRGRPVVARPGLPPGATAPDRAPHPPSGAVPPPAPVAGQAVLPARQNGLPALRAPGATPPGAPGPHLGAPRPTVAAPPVAAPGSPAGARPEPPAPHQVAPAIHPGLAGPPAGHPAISPVQRHQSAPPREALRPPIAAPAPHPAPAGPIAPPRPTPHEVARPQPQRPAPPPRPAPPRPAPPPPRPAAPPPRPAAPPPRPAAPPPRPPPPPRPAAPPPHPAPAAHKDEHPRP